MISTRAVLVGLVVALGALFGAACDYTPEQVDAFVRLVQHREAVHHHPFLECVRNHESRGNYSAQNPRSSASGAYQFLDSTWRNVSVKAGHGSYAKAKDAPEWVQDEVAHFVISRPVRETGGRGNWAGTGC